MTVYLIAGLLILSLVVWYLFREKNLEEYLGKYGTELEAEAKVIGTLNRGTTYVVAVNFQLNGQKVSKQIHIDSLVWFPETAGRVVNAPARKVPVLADPANPQRFLFNVRKFHFKKTSEDSVENFNERYNVEKPDSENEV